MVSKNLLSCFPRNCYRFIRQGEVEWVKSYWEEDRNWER